LAPSIIVGGRCGLRGQKRAAAASTFTVCAHMSPV
jgi:hypothetical protein